ncbi:response regulator transcription factor [Planobispora takensis]|uniref:Response regulatory domain-containing protein n=1 Tax=Planobispora takensis TaxID=1367882 RepID=A0A8J3T4J8_9ACTN|nr:response regulator [Planobispora takensis]GII05091.1 hypothetical protein Pta02_70990 [Planobispora takensis]
MAEVLVVEDDADIREVIAFRLRQDGHTIHAADDGAVAMTLLQSLRPDLVVLDWILPHISGVELCRYLRTLPGMEQVPVLMLTVRGEAADMRRGFGAGVSDYMTKPFSLQELSTRTQALLAQAAMRH